jgi:hypothetical protein
MAFVAAFLALGMSVSQSMRLATLEAQMQAGEEVMPDAEDDHVIPGPLDVTPAPGATGASGASTLTVRGRASNLHDLMLMARPEVHAHNEADGYCEIEMIAGGEVVEFERVKGKWREVR